MSDAGLTIVEMLNLRLQVVQQISAVQSRSLHNRQLGGGAEFELQRIAQEVAATGNAQAAAGALEDARGRLQRANAGMAACDALCTELERRLEELDRRIAAGR